TPERLKKVWKALIQFAFRQDGMEQPWSELIEAGREMIGSRDLFPAGEPVNVSPEVLEGVRRDLSVDLARSQRILQQIDSQIVNGDLDLKVRHRGPRPIFFRPGPSSASEGREIGWVPRAELP